MSNPMCTHDGCEAPAAFLYQWPWGEKGACCIAHKRAIEMQEESLDRKASFVAIADAQPAPLSRDDRTRMYAEILALKDELNEVKQRSMDLYNSNTQIGEQARRYAARNTELEAQVKDARADLNMAVDDRDRYRADLADANAELARLRAILPSHGSSPAPVELPSEPRS